MKCLLVQKRVRLLLLLAASTTVFLTTPKKVESNCLDKCQFIPSGEWREQCNTCLEIPCRRCAPFFFVRNIFFCALGLIRVFCVCIGGVHFRRTSTKASREGAGCIAKDPSIREATNRSSLWGTVPVLFPCGTTLILAISRAASWVRAVHAVQYKNVMLIPRICCTSFLSSTQTYLF